MRDVALSICFGYEILDQSQNGKGSHVGQGSINSILFYTRDCGTVEFWTRTYEMCQRFFSPISDQVVDPNFRSVYQFGASELDQ